MQLRELTSIEFNEFINLYPIYSLYQTKEYGEVSTQDKNTVMYLGLTEENRIVAASLIVIKKLNGFKYAYAHRGLLIDYSNYSLLETFTLEVKKYLKSKDVVAVKISPIILKKQIDKNGEIIFSNPNFDTIFDYLKKLEFYHFGYNNYFAGDQPRYEAVIKLEGNDSNSLFNKIDKKDRTKIRSSLRKGVKIYKGTLEHINYIYEHSKNKYLKNQNFYINMFNSFNESNSIDFFYAKLDTKEYLSYTKKSFEIGEEIVSKLGAELTDNSTINKNSLINKKMIADARLEENKKELVLATGLLKDSPSGIPVASVMTVKHNKTVYIMMDGFDPKFKNLNAKHLLLWTLINRYLDEGYHDFNIGGIPGIKTNNPKYNGLKEFKLNFDPYINEYIGDLELVTNNTLYFAYKQAKNISKMFEK